MPMPPVPPGFERSRINPDLFRLALITSMAARPSGNPGRPGVPPAVAARESGVNGGRISQLLNHGTMPSPADCIALLAWMHIDAALVLDPPEPKSGDGAGPAERAEQAA